MEEEIGASLLERGLTLVTAESCTGGLVAHRITNVSGSSAYFLGGIVAYANELKAELLGVRHETLLAHGAVSEETAREMARGARERLAAGVAVSITGIAGPTGGTPDKPVGLVYIALSALDTEVCERYIWSGDRLANKELSAGAALALVLSYLRSSREIALFPDAHAVALEAAQRLADLAAEAVSTRGRFSVALAGGSTPDPLYRLLAEGPFRTQIPWAQVHLFWADERCVPPDDPESNFHLANRTLITPLSIPAENVHRIPGELAPEAAARAYGDTLHTFFGLRWPRFDLVLLGMGSDGHTASLFPGAVALAETERLAVAVEAYNEDRPTRRVTLTLPALNAARQLLFLVSGPAKAEAVRAALEDPDRQLPAQQVRPSAGRITWLLDAEAGALLHRAQPQRVSERTQGAAQRAVPEQPKGDLP